LLRIGKPHTLRPLSAPPDTRRQRRSGPARAPLDFLRLPG